MNHLPFSQPAPTFRDFQQERSIFGVAHKERGRRDIGRAQPALFGAACRANGAPRKRFLTWIREFAAASSHGLQTSKTRRQILANGTGLMRTLDAKSRRSIFADGS
jgi:hypothetical protein